VYGLYIIGDGLRKDPPNEKCRVIYLSVQIDAANVQPPSTAVW